MGQSPYASTNKNKSIVGALLNTESNNQINENLTFEKKIKSQEIALDPDEAEDDYEEDDAFEEEEKEALSENNSELNKTVKAGKGKSAALIKENSSKDTVLQLKTSVTSKETLQGVKYGSNKLNQDSQSIKID